MIEEIFSFLDGIARFIGWGVIVFCAIWAFNQVMSEREYQRQVQREQKAKFAFETFLEESNPDRFRRYSHMQEENRRKGELVSWRECARDCGIPLSDILRFRNGGENET